jgi:hypothetical protein
VTFTLQVWEYAHGQDSRVVLAPQPRKSIGAQVYYGVRLDGEHDAEKFLDDLAGDRPCFHALAFR